MADITFTLTVEQALQTQTALGERINRLYSMPRDPKTFEGQVVLTANRHADEALVKLLDALYPPEIADDITQAKAAEFAGDHHIYPAGIAR